MSDVLLGLTITAEAEVIKAQPAEPAEGQDGGSDE